MPRYGSRGWKSSLELDLDPLLLPPLPVTAKDLLLCLRLPGGIPVDAPSRYRRGLGVRGTTLSVSTGTGYCLGYTVPISKGSQSLRFLWTRGFLDPVSDHFLDTGLAYVSKGLSCRSFDRWVRNFLPVFCPCLGRGVLGVCRFFVYFSTRWNGPWSFGSSSTSVYGSRGSPDRRCFFWLVWCTTTPSVDPAYVAPDILPGRWNLLSNRQYILTTNSSLWV